MVWIQLHVQVLRVFCVRLHDIGRKTDTVMFLFSAIFIAIRKL